MKKVFALIAAVAVVMSAQASFAASCKGGARTPRKGFLEARGNSGAPATPQAPAKKSNSRT